MLCKILSKYLRKLTKLSLDMSPKTLFRISNPKCRSVLGQLFEIFCFKNNKKQNLKIKEKLDVTPDYDQVY